MTYFEDSSDGQCETGCVGDDQVLAELHGECDESSGHDQRE